MSPALPVAPGARVEEPTVPLRASTVSVVVPVTERPHDLAWIYRTFSKEFVTAGRSFEFVFALEPWAAPLTEVLQPLIEAGENIRILEAGQAVGQSALLDAAASTCSSPILVTLPAYPRVEPGALEELVRRVERGADLASAVRAFEKTSWITSEPGVPRRPTAHGGRWLPRRVLGRMRDEAIDPRRCATLRRLFPVPACPRQASGIRCR